MALILWMLVLFFGAIAIAYFAVPGVAWVAAIGAMLVIAGIARIIPAVALIPIAAVFVLIAASLLIPDIRRRLFTAPVFAFYKRILPPMSETERDALEAGTTWWDGQ